MIDLSADLHIPEAEYANQGNAVLGIRDSGINALAGMMFVLVGGAAQSSPGGAQR